RWPARESLHWPARNRARRFARRVSSCRYACQPNPCELDAFFGLEKIPVSGADMRLRTCAGTAAQDVLVAHEFAVVFPEGTGRGAVTRIGRVGAARPFPDVAKQLAHGMAVICRRPVRGRANSSPAVICQLTLTWRFAPSSPRGRGLR